VLTAYHQGPNHSLTADFASILVKYLRLSVEAQTSSLTHSPLFPEWCSDAQEDLLFGSLGTFADAALLGRNILLVSPPVDQKSLKPKLAKIKKLVLSKSPARILFIGPPEQLLLLTDCTTLEIAKIPIGFPFLSLYNSVHRVAYSISITLIVNKESMWTDPIDWSPFKNDLLHWSNLECSNLTIAQITDLMFRERLVPSHAPRSISASQRAETSSTYQLLSPTPPRHENCDLMVRKGVPVHLAELIYKSNKHNPILTERNDLEF
jgi:hypothetical protein